MPAVATRSVQGRAVAELSAPEAMWDAIPDAPEVPDDVRGGTPSAADRRAYPTPAYYWEPEFPGMAMMPYPSQGHFQSEESGRWACQNRWQEDEVRSRLSRLANPDDLRVTDEQLAIIRGTVPGESRYCHTALCRFVSCSPLATRLHESLRGHTTKSEPRKDR